MRRLKRSEKLRVWVKDKFRCTHCGTKLTLETATVEHILATTNGGTNDWDNLTTYCRPCNFEKSKKDQALREYTKACRKFLVI